MNKDPVPQSQDIEAKLIDAKLNKGDLCKAAKVDAITKLPAGDGYKRALAWIDRQRA